MDDHSNCQRAIFDFIPQYCPNCGHYLFTNDRWQIDDYMNYCSFSCSCGLHYQKATPDLILKAAVDSGGDADRYWR